MLLQRCVRVRDTFIWDSAVVFLKKKLEACTLLKRTPVRTKALTDGVTCTHVLVSVYALAPMGQSKTLP